MVDDVAQEKGTAAVAEEPRPRLVSQRSPSSSPSYSPSSPVEKRRRLNRSPSPRRSRSPPRRYSNRGPPRRRSRSPPPRRRSRSPPYRGGYRGRSPPPRRYRGRDRSRSPRSRSPRSRSPSPRYRGGRRPRSPSPPPRNRRGPAPAREVPETAEQEYERGTRTVFVSKLPTDVTDARMHEFFEPVGTIREVRLIKDRHSKRSLGFGYIEFDNVMSINGALAMSGMPFGDSPAITVKPSESEKNLVPKSTGLPSGSGPSSVPFDPFSRVHLGNLPYEFSEADISSMMAPFGPIQGVIVPRSGNTTRGYAFVQFESPESAQRAMTSSVQFRGRPVRVGPVFEPRMEIMPSSSQYAPSMMESEGSFPGGSLRVTDLVASDLTSLDDADSRGSGVRLDAKSRALLIQKLAETTDQASSSTTKPAVEEERPTRTILLGNMFDQRESVKEPVMDEIEVDVQSECDSKFGKVIRVRAVRNSSGEVAVEFVTVASAQSAVKGLRGRFFGGKVVTAKYIDDFAFPK